MTTKARRPVFREVAMQVKGRALVIGIHPNGWITVRLKGTRRTAEARADWIYRNRDGIAKHQAKLQRRQARAAARQAAIDAQNEMMSTAKEK